MKMGQLDNDKSQEYELKLKILEFIKRADTKKFLQTKYSDEINKIVESIKSEKISINEAFKRNIKELLKKAIIISKETEEYNYLIKLYKKTIFIIDGFYNDLSEKVRYTLTRQQAPGKPLFSASFPSSKEIPGISKINNSWDLSSYPGLRLLKISPINIRKSQRKYYRNYFFYAKAASNYNSYQKASLKEKSRIEINMQYNLGDEVEESNEKKLIKLLKVHDGDYDSKGIPISNLFSSYSYSNDEYKKIEDFLLGNVKRYDNQRLDNLEIKHNNIFKKSPGESFISLINLRMFPCIRLLNERNSKNENQKERQIFQPGYNYKNLEIKSFDGLIEKINLIIDDLIELNLEKYIEFGDPIVKIEQEEFKIFYLGFLILELIKKIPPSWIKDEKKIPISSKIENYIEHTPGFIGNLINNKINKD